MEYTFYEDEETSCLTARKHHDQEIEVEREDGMITITARARCCEAAATVRVCMSCEEWEEFLCQIGRVSCEPECGCDEDEDDDDVRVIFVFDQDDDEDERPRRRKTAVRGK